MDKVVILGAKGSVGGQLQKLYGSDALAWDKEQVDISDAAALREKISASNPSAIINCAAYNDVDGAEEHREAAFALNATAVKNLAQLAAELKIPLLHFSTNYLFDGQAGEYAEDALPHPLSVYAQSKYQGEQELIARCPRHYLVRTAVVFGPPGQSAGSKPSFVQKMLTLAKSGAPVKAINDVYNSLTYAVDLAAAVKLLLEERKPFGIYHIVNSGRASWYDLAKEIFAIKNLPINLQAVAAREFPRRAAVPQSAVLVNTKLPQLRPWQEALREFLNNESGVPNP